MISDPLCIIHIYIYIYIYIKKKVQHCGTESTALLLTYKRLCTHKDLGSSGPCQSPFSLHLTVNFHIKLSAKHKKGQ